jgi:hypothetical protein
MKEWNNLLGINGITNGKLTHTHHNFRKQDDGLRFISMVGLLGRPRRRWVDYIKMDLREIGWDGVDWIELAQDRDQWRALVNTVMNFRVP